MFEWLFGYPRSTFEQAQWILDSDWPLWLLYALLFLSAFGITFFLVNSRRALSIPKLFSLGLLQSLMLFGVLMLLWQPSLLVERLKPNENSIALMLDASQSMAYEDNGELRIDTARELLGSESVSDLVASYQTDRYLFSENAAEVEGFESLPDPGATTRIGNSLLEVLERAKAKSLAAVILVSDGSESGEPLAQEQLAEIAAFGVPVHVIGVGRERVAEDIELERLVVPERVLPNTLVTAEASIRHDAPGMARLKAYNGDEFLGSQDVNLESDSGVTTARIEFDLGTAGFKELSFQLDPIEGEINLENNRRTHMVEVADQSYSVLYVEGEPRWEYKFIRRALVNDPTTDLMTLLWVSDNKFYRQGVNDASQLATGFPETKEELFGFDAVIIGSLEAPRLTSDQQQLLYEFVSERGGSLMMLGGRKGLAEGSWGNTPLGELLPVRLKGIEDSYVKERATAMLTPQGANAAFLTFEDNSDSNADRWLALPPLDNYQELGTLRPAAETLLSVRNPQETETRPLLVTQRYGRGQSFVFATGGTWRWQMGLPSDDDSHQTFWRQLMRALVVNSPERMNFTVEAEGSELKLTAEVFDDNFSPMDDVRVLAVMSAGETTDAGLAAGVELSPSLDVPGRYETRLPATERGTYFIDAIASRGESPIDAARVAIHQEDMLSEAFGIRQNRAQLERIAEVTGGSYWTQDSIDQLAEAVGASSAGIVEQIRHPLWNIPFVFLCLILLKVSEWLLRRRWGHI